VATSRVCYHLAVILGKVKIKSLIFFLYIIERITVEQLERELRAVKEAQPSNTILNSLQGSG
jgi:hypothetical protein